MNVYILPIIIIILLFAFIIYASTVEKFSNNCKCADGSELRNGGCYSCEKGYKLSKDYYNPYCVSDTPGSGNNIKGAKYNSVTC